MQTYKKIIGYFLFSFILTSTAFAEDAGTKKVLDHHLGAFGAGDVEGILSDYTEQSVIILPTGILRGKKSIKGLFDGFVEEFSQQPTVFKLVTSTVSGDVAYIVWTAETPLSSYSFASDTFVVENGKIKYQTVAFVRTAK